MGFFLLFRYDLRTLIPSSTAEVKPFLPLLKVCTLMLSWDVSAGEHRLDTHHSSLAAQISQHLLEVIVHCGGYSSLHFAELLFQALSQLSQILSQGGVLRSVSDDHLCSANI